MRIIIKGDDEATGIRVSACWLTTILDTLSGTSVNRQKRIIRILALTCVVTVTSSKRF